MDTNKIPVSGESLLDERDIQSFLDSIPKEEIFAVLNKAKTSKIRAREDIYIERVPDEILKNLLKEFSNLLIG